MADQTGHNSISPSCQIRKLVHKTRHESRFELCFLEGCSYARRSCTSVSFPLPPISHIDRPLICSTASKTGPQLPSRSVSPSLTCLYAILTFLDHCKATP